MGLTSIPTSRRCRSVYITGALVGGPYLICLFEKKKSTWALSIKNNKYTRGEHMISKKGGSR